MPCGSVSAPGDIAWMRSTRCSIASRQRCPNGMPGSLNWSLRSESSITPLIRTSPERISQQVTHSPDLAFGSDGLGRCPWSASTPDYVEYHDREWGRAVHGDREIFERLTLEAFQSGLSWLTILRKRPAFRTAFAGFDPVVVAGFSDVDRERLLTDVGIVRNRAKIDATITNARALVRLQDEGGQEALDSLIWSFAPSHHRQPHSLAEVPARTSESSALARELKRRGFVFVGPTTMYAAMQAMGLVNDHLRGCSAEPGPSG